MKNIAGIFCVLILLSCLGKKSAQYTLPQGLTEQEKKAFELRFKKGEELYKTNCAKCHNYNEGRKKNMIPDFNPLQLKNYTIRVQNKDHNRSLSEQQISEQDLAAVVHFLMYRKK